MIVYDSSDFNIVCQGLKSNDPTFAIVNLSLSTNSGLGHQINDAQAKQLVDSLANNTCVTELYLNIAKLSVRGGAFLMQCLLSSQSLEIVSLQGCLKSPVSDPDSHQVLVVDVLIRAALLNPANLCLEFESCPIARSSLLAALEAPSLLSEIFLASPCRLVVDNEDPILEERSFSETIHSLHVASHNLLHVVLNNNDDERHDRLTEWLLECCVHLPKLTTLGLVNCQVPSFERFLLKSRSLKEIQFTQTTNQEHHQTNNTERYDDSIINYLQHTDSLERAYLNLPHTTPAQQRDLCRAVEQNRSLVRVWQSPVISPKLEGYCERNQQFLEHWKDLTESVSPSLWPLAASIGIQSERGRTALFQRLPSLLSSSW
jgi:hypothetical protein